jgi:hypothetical protein
VLWEMGHKRCNEFRQCGVEWCPSFDNAEQDQCWLMPLTRCQDPITGDSRPKNVREKMSLCMGMCEYRSYRSDLVEETV